jgi:SWI/SNF-related matrix-associated actin-dependent regulator 1 of chromatin subfamily A
LSNKPTQDYDVAASKAQEASFYHAPHPEDVQPMDYQFAGAEYALARDHCIIGDAPGLGKSCEGVLIGNAIEAKRTLVVCPASLRLNWQREVNMWSTIENVTTYPVLKAKDGISSEANYVIMSYSLLAKDNLLDAILDLNWDHVILDEAHAMKDPKGNTRTKAIAGWESQWGYIPGLVDVTNRFSLLTGTLMPNQPVEAYNAIRLCNWDAIDQMSLDAFRNYYYGKGGGMVRGPYEHFDQKRQQIVMKHGLHWSDEVRNKPRRLSELQERLRKNVMVRRLKQDVLTQLPPIQWHPFPLEMTGALKKALKHEGFQQAEKLYDIDPEAFDGGIPIDGAISSARRELGEAKAPQVVAYVEEILREGAEKVVVSAWHRSVLDILRKGLEKYGLVYMDGNTSATKKQMAVDDFQLNDKIRIILGQKMPLGEGWTLTKAQDTIDAEPDWVPGRNEQLVERVNRMGQTGEYTIGHLAIAPGTLDERIINNMVKKAQNIYAALDA